MQFRVYVIDGVLVDVWLQFEDGMICVEVVQVDNFILLFDFDGCWIGEVSFVLFVDLFFGYYWVNLCLGDLQVSVVVVVMLDWLGLLDKLVGCCVWGLVVQFYSVWFWQLWGIGDFIDLVNFVLWLVFVYGVGYVLVNFLYVVMFFGFVGCLKLIELLFYLLIL